MSRSWTPKELAQASEDMQAQGYIGYNEFCQGLSEKHGIIQMDGFTPKGMHWYMEQVGERFDVFVCTDMDVDSYKWVCTGSHDECMNAVRDF